MIRARAFLFSLCLAVWLAASLPPAAVADPGAAALDDSTAALLERAVAALEAARADDVDLLAPRRFGQAQDAYEQARSLADRGRKSDLIRMKLKLSLEGVEEARRAADSARLRLEDVLAARHAAQAAGADSLGVTTWQQAEDMLLAVVRDLERTSTGPSDAEVEDIAGTYRAARLDALRSTILTEARGAIASLERKGGTKTVSTLVLRAHQAMSRAEADIAREDLDAARAEARTATRAARHGLALMTFVENAQAEKQTWEETLLRYDDVLGEIAAYLGGELDFSEGGTQAAAQIFTLIEARDDSIAAAFASEQERRQSFEESLAEAQTTLADAQDRIAELEKRLQVVEGDRTAARQALQKGAITAERIGRAQSVFHSGEAVVLHEGDGRVVIRLQGLRFSPGATKLEKTHLTILNHAAEAIGEFPGAAIVVEGHTDADGGEETNQKLSEARAAAVADYLATKLSSPDVTYTGYGETQPIASNDTKDGRSRNRRIDLVLTLP